jgi:hypothetical protein
LDAAFALVRFAAARFALGRFAGARFALVRFDCAARLRGAERCARGTSSSATAPARALI